MSVPRNSIVVYLGSEAVRLVVNPTIPDLYRHLTRIIELGSHQSITVWRFDPNRRCRKWRPINIVMGLLTIPNNPSETPTFAANRSIPDQAGQEIA